MDSAVEDVVEGKRDDDENEVSGALTMNEVTMNDDVNDDIKGEDVPNRTNTDRRAMCRDMAARKCRDIQILLQAREIVLRWTSKY